MPSDFSAPIGWVLYDEACGLCRQGVRYWAGTLHKRGFDVAPLQSDWVIERLSATEEELLADLQLLLADGTCLRGADAYRYVMRRIWWAYPLYLLSVAPLLRRLFDRGYRSFADYRHQVSRACRIPDPTADRLRGRP